MVAYLAHPVAFITQPVIADKPMLQTDVRLQIPQPDLFSEHVKDIIPIPHRLAGSETFGAKVQTVYT